MKSTAACFRLGDLYRDMDSGIGIALHALGELDYPELGQAFFRIRTRANMIREEFFPDDEILSEIIETAGGLWGAVKWLAENRKRPTKSERKGIEDGIKQLLWMIENDFFRVAHGACGGG